MWPVIQSLFPLFIRKLGNWPCGKTPRRTCRRGDGAPRRNQSSCDEVRSKPAAHCQDSCWTGIRRSHKQKNTVLDLYSLLLIRLSEKFRSIKKNLLRVCVLHDGAQQQRSPWLPNLCSNAPRVVLFKISARPSYDTAKSDGLSRRQCKEKHNFYPLVFFFLQEWNIKVCCV